MENRYASIWNHANEGILISDKSGKIVLVNPSCAALFGYSEDEILDIGIDALIPEAARSRHKKYREHYNEQPTNRSMGRNMTLYGLKKDKSVFPLEISLSHYNSQGEMFVIAFIIDITERLNFQEDLQVVNKQLLTLNENLERKVKERIGKRKRAARNEITLCHHGISRVQNATNHNTFKRFAYF